ncbi:MAG: DUF1338 family protein [Planctomycetota bacterium]
MLPSTNLSQLLDRTVGSLRAQRILNAIEIPESLRGPKLDHASRQEIAMGLSVVLFEDLLREVTSARAYLGDAVRHGRKLVFDHGALRTVATDCGDLPAGQAAFERILKPLGYQRRETYPLERLSMTGRSWAHSDLPEDLPQYFVSELHPERFSEEFQAAVQRVVRTSVDPLRARARHLLERLAQDRVLPIEEAADLIRNLAPCFGRQHPEPQLADYETLLAESPEMAWIATEGNSFNHATDRVLDLGSTAEHQRLRNRPIKSDIEVSGSGRVRQTAFRASTVERLFVDSSGHLVPRRVPGSFHEIISRATMEDGSLDLAFDAANAQGIFKMTTIEGASEDNGPRS